MLIPTNFESYDDSYVFAVALYLDAYPNADCTLLYLPKRSYKDILSVKRTPHLTIWSGHNHTAYRKLPATMDLEQFVVLEDSWAAETFELLRTQFADNLKVAARVAFFMWKNVLFWSACGSRNYVTGYVTTYDKIATLCRCSERFAVKVVLAMLDAGLLHRKWVGDGLTRRGSCYLAGKANHIEELLAQNENKPE